MLPILRQAPILSDRDVLSISELIFHSRSGLSSLRAALWAHTTNPMHLLVLRIHCLDLSLLRYFSQTKPGLVKKTLLRNRENRACLDFPPPPL